MQPQKKLRVPDLAKLLQERCLASHAEADSRFASSRDIASEYGVALLTADRAVKLLVEQGVLYRRPGCGTYVCGQARQQKVIGMAVDSLLDCSLAKGSDDEVITYLHEAGAQLRVISYAELKNPQTASRMLDGLDGLLLSGSYLDAATLKNLSGFTAPVGLIHYNFPYQSHFHQVVLDFSEAFDQIVSAIPEECRIWLLYGDHPNGQYRRDEFLAALKRRGIGRSRFSEISIRYVAGSDIVIYREALELAKTARGTFVFCTSDQLSDIFLNAFIHEGLVPIMDFEWVSCDNLSKFGYGTPGLPRLTTVDCHADEMVLETVKLLLGQLNHPSDCQIIARKRAHLIRGETARFPT